MGNDTRIPTSSKSLPGESLTQCTLTLRPTSFCKCEQFIKFLIELLQQSKVFLAVQSSFRRRGVAQRASRTRQSSGSSFAAGSAASGDTLQPSYSGGALRPSYSGAALTASYSGGSLRPSGSVTASVSEFSTNSGEME